MLSEQDLALHQKLGIDAALLDERQVRRVDDREAREALGVNGRAGRLDGVLYPYLVPWQARPVTHRVRRDFPEYEGGKPKNKYISGYGDHRHLYFATTDPALLTDVAVRVLIVEAEKSALSATSAARRTGQRLLAIGTGGCWGWRGRVGIMTDATGARVEETGPLPDWDHIEWRGRDVVILFDANTASNPKVQAARRALARELANRGARVRIGDVPVEDGVNGPDDYVGRHGDADFFALLDTAADARTHDVIYRLNQMHAVVGEAGKAIVVTEEHDPVMNRRVLTRSTFPDFRNWYLNESVEVGVDKKTGTPIRKPLGNVWLAHPDRRQYQGLVMSPGGDVPGYLNLWRGFAVEPKPGSWSRFQAHIEQVICAKNTTLVAYVLAWLAFAVQHPERQAEVALALRGPRGAGKGVFARTFGALFGQHYLQIANTKHLTGHFNAHLQDCVLLFADEAFWAGDKAGESVLKMLVTEPVIPIERKGRDLVLAPNLLHIILASNHDWIVPAGMDERRFCVLDIDPVHQQDTAYFAKLAAEMADGGLAAMLYDLQHHDISTFNLRELPQTEALRQQKVLSLQPNERWLFDKLMSGELLPGQGWPSFVAKETLHDDYVRTLQKAGVDRRATETELGMFIAKMLPDVRTARRTVDKKRAWCLTLADLHACRRAFDAATKSVHPWDEDDGD